MNIVKQRYNWIDSLRTLAILLVVLGHINSPFSRVIYSFHIPLFFFISGFFIKVKQKPFEFIKGQFEKLMLPFWIFGFVGAFMEYLKRFLVILFFPELSVQFDLVNYGPGIKEILLGLFYWLDFAHLKHYGFVLWFLPALFLGKTVVFLVIKYLRRFSFLLIIPVLLVTRLHWPWPYAIDKALIASLYIFMGYLFWSNYKECFQNWLSVILFGFIIILCTFFNIQSNLNIATMSITIFEFFYSIVVILFLVNIFFLLGNIFPNYLTIFGKESMLILIIHPYTNNLAFMIVLLFFGSHWFIIFFLSILLLLPFLFFKNKTKNWGCWKYV